MRKLEEKNGRRVGRENEGSCVWEWCVLLEVSG